MLQVETHLKIFRHDIYTLCNNKNYYTCGDAEAYEELLNYVDTLEDIPEDKLGAKLLHVAKNIYEHSDIEGMRESFGVSKEEIFQNIYYEVGKCVNCFCDVISGL